MQVFVCVCVSVHADGDDDDDGLSAAVVRPELYDLHFDAAQPSACSRLCFRRLALIMVAGDVLLLCWQWTMMRTMHFAREASE